MRFCYRSHLVVAFTIASTCSAFAQPGPVGSVTIQVHNTFGSSVGNSLQQCTGCSYTPSPPTFVSNNTTSSPFTASAVSGGYNFTATTRYSALKSSSRHLIWLGTTVRVQVWSPPQARPRPTASIRRRIVAIS